MSSWDIKQAELGTAGPLLELNFSFKNLATLQQLVSVTSLVRLNLSFNCLTQLQGISALTNLQQLDVGHNSLTQLDIGCTALTKLTQLVCSHNKICSTDVVAQLTSLQFLALHSNKISKAADVSALSQLTQLQYLSLCSNPACKQDNWQHATIALLPNLQALDKTAVSAEQRAAASAYSDLWVTAGQQEYSCSSTPRDISTATSESGGRAGVSSNGDPLPAGLVAPRDRLSSRGSNGSAGRLRPRVSSGTALDDAMSIKDATSLLPSMTLESLKPSSLVRKPVKAPTPSKYGYSRSKPITVLQKQQYKSSGTTAVLVHSDGSASLTWPEGSMAATLDAEAPPAAGSAAANASGSSASSTPPIKGYRMLAMYRSVVGVAASFDSSGGFVQWPNGQLMLVWDRKDGTAYGPDGRVTHRFTKRRKPPGALTGDITAQLDEHLSIRFTASKFELQLLFECEGCQALLSQQHGTVLEERAREQQQQQQQLQSATLPTAHTSSSRQVPDSSQGLQHNEPQSSSTASGTVAAALADLPGGDDMQALLARARALMAATDLSVTEVATAAAQHPDAANESPGAASSGHLMPSVTQPAAMESAGSRDIEDDTGDGDDEDDAAAADLKLMMARARAAIAATAASLQEVQL